MEPASTRNQVIPRFPSGSVQTTSNHVWNCLTPLPLLLIIGANVPCQGNAANQALVNPDEHWSRMATETVETILGTRLSSRQGQILRAHLSLLFMQWRDDEVRQALSTVEQVAAHTTDPSGRRACTEIVQVLAGKLSRKEY